MNKLRAIIIASSALVAASAAQAADIVAAPAPTWTGFYFGVGVGGGYSFADTSVAGGGFYDDYYEIEELPAPALVQGELSPVYNLNTANVLGSFFCDAGFCSGSTGADAGFKDDQGKAGILGRAEIGADYQFDRIVAGVNASFTLGSRDMSSKGGGSGGGDFYDSRDEGSSGGGGYGAVKSSLDIGNSWSIGGRLGYLVTDNTLVFGAGGYTQEEADLKARFQGESGAGNEYGGIEGAYNAKASSDEWLDGYYVGGGLETLLTEHFSLKLEYRYADYGSIKAKKGDSYYGDCVGEGACFGYGAGVKAKADVTDQSVMATISFRM